MYMEQNESDKIDINYVGLYMDRFHSRTINLQVTFMPLRLAHCFN